MNKYNYQNENREEYSQMNVTQQLMAGFGDETETAAAENETADISASDVSENAAEAETEKSVEAVKNENIISELRAELESERGIFKTVLDDKSSTIAYRNATIAEYEAAQKAEQEAASKKGKGLFGLKP